MLETITHDDFRVKCNIKYGFFCRTGGISSGDFDSLNINSSKLDGESIENVKKNLKLIQDFFKSKNKVFKIKQVHSNKVVHLNDLNELSNRFIIEGDAVVTKLKDVVIGISTADCVPLLIVDDSTNIIAAVHAGWRSAITGVIENTILKILEIGGSLDNLSVVIGPHLRVKNFEVQMDFVDILKEKNIDTSEYIFINNDKMFFDITKYVKDVLIKMGIKRTYDVDLDTYDCPKKFFSYRRSCHEKKKFFGCQFSAIML